MCKRRKEISRRMVGIEEVSIILGLKPQTIRNRLSSGTFPLATYKVLGRLKWKLSDVENYINNLERIN